MLAGDDAGYARVWNLADGTPRCALPRRSGGLAAAVFDPTGERFAVAGEDGAVVLARTADCQPGAEVKTTSLQAGRARMRSVAAGAAVLLGGGAGQISAWEPGTWRQQWREQVHRGEVKALAVLRDGRWSSGGLDFVVTLSGRRLGALSQFPLALLPAPDGKAVLAADVSGQLTRLPLDGSAPAVLLEAENPLYALALRPNHSEVVVGGVLRDLYHLPMPPQGKPTRWPAAFPGHGVTALAYSPDGRWLAEGSTHGDLALRDPDSGDIQYRLTGLHDAVYGLVLTPHHLWAGATNGLLLRFALPCAAAPSTPATGCTPAPQGDIAPDLAPILEGAPINGLALTPDGRFLIAALGDGRASVRALPDGTLVAHLVPLRDGSWATLFADGHYEASSTGLATSLLMETPDRGITTLDGRPLRLEIADIARTPLAEGAFLVRATVLSPRGLPTVLLDGRWPVQSVIPSPSIARAYDIEFLVDDPTAGPHWIEASAPDLPPTRKDFLLGPDFRRARALVVANQAYTRVPKVPGALEDGESLAEALSRASSWGLPRDRIRLLPDRTSATLQHDIEAFFAGAAPGETLLFYFAGHGFTRPGPRAPEGFLLPIDANPAASDPGFRADALWTAIRRSKADTVLVILDACRSGSFLLPAEAIGRPAEATASAGQGPRVGVLTASSAAAAAGGTAAGGTFTQAIVRALHEPESADPWTGVVTVQRAYLEALRAAGAQNPRLFGALDQMVLARPPREGSAAVLPAASGNPDNAVQVQEAKVVTLRQIAVEGQRVEGSGADRQLILRLFFAHATDSVRVGIHYPFGDPKAPARPELFKRAGGGRGQQLEIVVPLKGLHEGLHRVTIEPCGAHGKCPSAMGKELQLNL